MRIFKNKTKIELGQTIKDTITGLEGICVARTEWLHGCARVTIQPPLDKDGKVPDNYTIDELQAEVIKTNDHEPERDPGGPRPAPTQKSGPVR